jgi:hypothetical protein
MYAASLCTPSFQKPNLQGCQHLIFAKEPRMKLLFGIAVLVFIALLFVAAIKSKKKAQATVDKYLAKQLLSDNEKQWYMAIKEAVPHAHVFGQVALNQLVKAANGKQWRSAKNKIDPRSIDFVVLNPDLVVLLTIEIDDKSHQAARRQTDDEKKNVALRSADIPLLRIPATPALSVEEIKKRIVETIAAHARNRISLSKTNQ